MAKPANKSRGEVAVPEFGSGAFLRFTVDSLERLESEFDDAKGWLINVVEGLSGMKMSVIRKCVEVSLIREGISILAEDISYKEVDDIDSLRSRILDALFLILYKRTFDEQKVFEEEKQTDGLTRRLKDFDSDPHRAALLSLLLSGGPDMKQDSDPTKSAA